MNREGRGKVFFRGAPRRLRPYPVAPTPPFHPLHAFGQGDGKAALKGVCRASLRLSRPGALRFSSGLFLHMAADACFTILEQVSTPGMRRDALCKGYE